MRRTLAVVLPVLAAGTCLRAQDWHRANLATPSPAVVSEIRREAGPAVPGSAPVVPATTAPSSGYQSWKWSLAPLAASQVLDVASSWNRLELNPVLADNRGAFGAKAAAIKSGVVGAFVGVQYLLVKKYPKTAKVFSKINWTSALVTGGFAAHNFATR